MPVRTMLLALLLSVFTASAVAQEGSVVKVEKTEEGYRLLVNGEPYFIRGAGGQGHLDLLVESGGNSFRTWGADDAQRHLDNAHKLGLKVTLGIWLGHERHGFDYTNEQQVQAQRDMVEKVVLEFKDHPALLMWGIGNEVELTTDPNKVFPEIEHIAAMVKRLDPHHPTMAVIAGAEPEKIDAFVRLCPSVDVLGVNSYGSAAYVPDALERAGYTGPYALTEFGPRGWWESPKAPWGAQIEPTGIEKIETYRRAYEGAVASRPDRCVGSYVFLWGQKQEATATWFSLFLEDGSKTALVDLMQELWTGTQADNRAPIVGAIQSTVALAEVKPGVEFTASVEATEPDGEEMVAEWIILDEATDRRMGGDAEQAPSGHPELTLSSELQGARLRTPSKPGQYRLFVTVRDVHGHAGTANVPFLVVAD